MLRPSYKFMTYCPWLLGPRLEVRVPTSTFGLDRILRFCTFGTPEQGPYIVGNLMLQSFLFRNGESDMLFG